MQDSTLGNLDNCDEDILLMYIYISFFSYSNIACHMLCSVGDFIDTGIDDQMAAMQDSTLENLDDSSDEDEMDQDDIQKWVV